MGSEWMKGTLADIAEVVMGQSPKGENCNNNGEGLALLNGPTEFGPSHPFPTQFTTDPKKKAQKGDLLFCVRGSTTGRMNWADQEYAIGRGIGAFRHKSGSIFQPYLRSLIECYLPTLLQSATGSTFPNVSRDQFLNLEIDIMPDDDAKRVAQIIGSLDNKIELNRQTNQTLEQMAQALFKSWFVDFDPVVDNALEAGNEIPEPLKKKAERRAAMRAQQKAQAAPATQDAQQGAVQTTLHTPSQTQSHATKSAHSHANNSTVNNYATNTDTDQVADLLTQGLPEHLRALFPSEFEETDELGWVPKGWEAGSLSSIATGLSGFAFKGKDFVETGEAVIKIKNINSARGVNIEDVNRVSREVAATAEKSLLKDGDLIMAMTGATVGKFGILVAEEDEGYYLNQRVCKLTSTTTAGNVFLYSALNKPGVEESIVDSAQGSAQPNISATAILSTPMIVPSSELIDLFISKVKVSYLKRISLKKQDYKLTKLRDTLLPKLISGELRLPEVDTAPDHNEALA